MYSYVVSIFMSIYFILFFFFNATPTPEIYTLSLHDALPICSTRPRSVSSGSALRRYPGARVSIASAPRTLRSCETRSEEHTSELQSPDHLVCRLLLEKKNTDD